MPQTLSHQSHERQQQRAFPGTGFPRDAQAFARTKGEGHRVDDQTSVPANLQLLNLDLWRRCHGPGTRRLRSTPVTRAQASTARFIPMTSELSASIGQISAQGARCMMPRASAII